MEDHAAAASLITERLGALLINHDGEITNAFGIADRLFKAGALLPGPFASVVSQRFVNPLSTICQTAEQSVVVTDGETAVKLSREPSMALDDAIMISVVWQGTESVAETDWTESTAVLSRVAALEGLLTAIGPVAIFSDDRGVVQDVWRPEPGTALPSDVRRGVWLSNVWPLGQRLVERVIESDVAQTTASPGGATFVARPVRDASGQRLGVAITPGAMRLDDTHAEAINTYLETTLERALASLSTDVFALLRDGAPAATLDTVTALSFRLSSLLDTARHYRAAAQGAAPVPLRAMIDIAATEARYREQAGLTARGDQEIPEKAEATGQHAVVNVGLLDAVATTLTTIAKDWGGGNVLSLTLAMEQSTAQLHLAVSATGPANAHDASSVKSDLRLLMLKLIGCEAVDVHLDGNGAAAGRQHLHLKTTLAADIPDRPAASSPITGRRVCLCMPDTTSRATLAAALIAAGLAVSIIPTWTAITDCLERQRYDAFLIDLLSAERSPAELLGIIASARSDQTLPRMLAIAPGPLDPVAERHMARGYDALLPWPPDDSKLREILTIVLS